MANTSKRRFLVMPLDAESLQIPENAYIANADNIETLLEAQVVRETVVEFINGHVPFRTIKQLLRPKS